MKYLLLKVMLACALCATYVASPFVTAWQIREAVRNGDSRYLENAIEWDSLRASLKPSLSQLALNLPQGATTTPVKPTLWQRIKAYWGRSAVDTAVDSYLTPEGLPKLFALRASYRTLSGAADDRAQPVLERVKRAWARVKRAEFTSWSTFELDMIDKHDETRLIMAKLHLTSVGWKLREVRFKTLQSAESRIQRFTSSAAASASTPRLNPSPSLGARLLDGLSFIGKARAAAQPAL